MHRPVLTPVCVWLCLMQALPSCSAPSAEPLTIDRAIEVAIQAHPAVKAAAKQVEAARAELGAARSWPTPELLVTPIGSIDDSQAALVQPLGLAARPAETAAARARWESARAGLAAARCDLVYRVRVAFYNLLAARSSLQVATQSADLLQQVHDAARKSLELGNGPESHVLRTRLELARARRTVREAEANRDALAAALNETLGRDPLALTEITGDLPAPAPVPEFAALKADLLGRRPDLLQARWELRAREADVAAARAACLPDLSLDVRQTRLRERGGTFGVGISLPFVDWGRRRAAVSSADALAASARSTVDAEEAKAVAELAAELARLRSAAESAGEVGNGILADAGRLSEMARTGYEEGALSYLEALDAQAALAQTRQSAIEARLAYANSRAAIDRAIGEPAGPTRDRSDKR